MGGEKVLENDGEKRARAFRHSIVCVCVLSLKQCLQSIG